MLSLRPFEPMLCASKATIADIRFPTDASTKFDGIRCMIRRATAVSRTLIDIPNRFVQSCLQNPLFEGFDGELIVGLPNVPTTYRSTESGVMSEDGEPDFAYYVFDDTTDEDLSFELRTSNLRRRIARLNANGFTRLIFVEQNRVDNLDELHRLYVAELKRGYEGLICKSPVRPYKRGRSTINEGGGVKLKPRDPLEVEIIGVYEELKNNNVATKSNTGRTKRASNAENKVAKGSLGGYHVLVRDWTNSAGILYPETKFKVGAGSLFTKAFRKGAWERHLAGQGDIGKTLRLSYCPIGSDKAPRQPMAEAFRHSLDMS